MEWPALADLAPGVFPADVVSRAKELSAEIGSIGAYSHSQGVPFIRKSVAKFIEGTCVSVFLLPWVSGLVAIRTLVPVCLARPIPIIFGLTTSMDLVVGLRFNSSWSLKCGAARRCHPCPGR
jgi:hypothetical protein